MAILEFWDRFFQCKPLRLIPIVLLTTALVSILVFKVVILFWIPIVILSVYYILTVLLQAIVFWEAFVMHGVFSVVKFLGFIGLGVVIMFFQFDSFTDW